MRASFVGLLLVVASSPCGCRSERGNSGTAATPSTMAPVPAPSATAVDETEPSSETPSPLAGGATKVKLARCGWGAASASSAPDAMPWAIALVDIDLPGDVKGLHVTALELGNEHGVVAKMGDRVALRFQEGALTFSYGATDTREVAETLTAGPVRLRAAAALDRPAKRILPQRPTTCSVALSDSAGQVLVATGNVDPEWKNE